jgi:hypothetical protein
VSPGHVACAVQNASGRSAPKFASKSPSSSVVDVAVRVSPGARS